MSLRNRIFALVSAAVALTVVLVTSTVSSSARRAFAAVDAQRAAAVVAQIRREFAAEGEQVATGVERVAGSDVILRMAGGIGQSKPDFVPHVGEAAPVAAAQALDFLDLVADSGTIISSAHWPARFGYQHPWASEASRTEAGSGRAFLQKVELPGDLALGLDRRPHCGGGGTSPARGRRPPPRSAFSRGSRAAGGHARPAVPESRVRSVRAAAVRRLRPRLRCGAAGAAHRARPPERTGSARNDRVAGSGNRFRASPSRAAMDRSSACSSSAARSANCRRSSPGFAGAARRSARLASCSASRSATCWLRASPGRSNSSRTPRERSPAATGTSRWTRRTRRPRLPISPAPSAP